MPVSYKPWNRKVPGSIPRWGNKSTIVASNLGRGVGHVVLNLHNVAATEGTSARRKYLEITAPE